jgi:ketosteroid isomerase-like protein
VSGLHGEECVCDDCLVLDEEQDMKKALVGHVRTLEARVAELEGALRATVGQLEVDEDPDAAIAIARAALATKPGGGT